MPEAAIAIIVAQWKAEAWVLVSPMSDLAILMISPTASVVMANMKNIA